MNWARSAIRYLWREPQNKIAIAMLIRALVILIIFAGVLEGLRLWNSTLHWDISRDHSVDKIGWSPGAGDVQLELHGRYSLTLKYSDDIYLQEEAQSIHAFRNGANLSAIEIRGKGRTLKDAYSLVRSMIEHWKLQRQGSTETVLHDLDEWYLFVKGMHQPVQWDSGAKRDFGLSGIQIAILTSWELDHPNEPVCICYTFWWN